MIFNSEEKKRYCGNLERGFFKEGNDVVQP